MDSPSCTGFPAPGRWSRPVVAIATAAVLGFMMPQQSSAAASASAKTGYFAAARSIDLLGDVYREVSENYVDPVDVSELMFSGIDGMLDKLDPYTAFLDESETEELDELTRGQYAGIGITIGVLAGDLYIMSTVDGNAAAKAGIRTGDRIVTVNGVKVSNKPLDDVRSAIKGPVGSSVRLGISRSGVRGLREYSLTRAEVRVRSVTYSGLFGSVGYVEMNSFGERTPEELRAAVVALQRQAASSGALRGLVLDLRGNPGGLLTSAVEVAGVFLDKGSTVVSTRGRKADSGQSYVTKTDPLVPALPLAVLIDGDSASASEIVAGAIQEHDRGVIVGEGSFGKGLVQSIIPLPYDHELKLTTSKYYTPSGRLIQKPIARTEGTRKVISSAGTYDSTKVFYTLHRRKVFGGGGIRPDLLVRAPEPSGYEHALEKNGMFFRFANSYRAGHDRLLDHDLQNGRLFGDFSRFVDGEHFVFRSRSQLAIDSLKTLIRKEFGSDGDRLSTRLGDLEKELKSRSGRALAGDSVRISAAVKKELLRHYDENAARRTAIAEDPVTLKAFALLADPKTYRSLLRP